MNRPAVGPQSLRGLPNGFPTQPQMPQNRSVSNRLAPTGKLASNGATWAFGGGVPMGSAGLGNPRTSSGPMTSFAQTIGASSQPTTPLDLSEFPSLSNNQPQSSQSTWAASGARNIGPSANLRLQQQSTLTAQQQLNAQQQTQQQQDDLFSSSSQLPSSQAGFRFGSQNAVGQASQSNNADEFPPLSRSANGDIPQDRTSNLLQHSGFSAQSNGLGFGATSLPQPNRNNGLLNALSGNSRAPSGNRAASPGAVSGVSNSRSPVEQSRQGLGASSENDAPTFSNLQPGHSIGVSQREDSLPHTTMSRSDGPAQPDESTVGRSQNMVPNPLLPQDNMEELAPEVQDPLAHMSEIDKWGLKGFSLMMNNFADYAALVTGSDMANIGIDLQSPELISNQVYSLWDSEPPRPAIPRYTLPDCYTVGNIAQLESKLTNFNDEALIFMFYSNPGDVQQLQAAQELHNRNWRYHKKLQLWLTKDDMMIPQSMGNGTERGYYVFFNITDWNRERREFTLVYDELETVPIAGGRPLTL